MEIPELPLEKCEKCKYHGIAKLGQYDEHVCLATGELTLLKDVEKCPLEKEEKEEVKETVPVEIPFETLKNIAEKIEAAYDILLKIGNVVSQITVTFDTEDLIALLRGRTRLRVRDIKAVLNALEKARKVGPRDALKKFVSAVGNVPMKDVALVINEIERLREKYVKKEEIKKILLEAEGE